MRTSMSSAGFRDLFPSTRNLVYFNHAAVGSLSVRACEAMEAFARDQRDNGALHWRDWYAEYDRARESAARLIGATADEIAILKNTSEGLSFVAQGLRWETGDNVVTSALEFPSNWSPWKRLDGVEVRVAGTRDGFTPEEVEKLIDDRTRLVTISSVAFHNGFASDLDAIGAICAKRNVLLCVDAIQSVGMLPTDVRRANIAFLAADGHKWMCGTEGAAIFYAAAEHRDKLDVLEIGWTNVVRKGSFIDCGTELVPTARRFEAGSLNSIGIHGLRAAIDLLLEIGMETVSTNAIRVATQLADALESIGFAVSTRPVRSAIVGAIPPDVEKTSILYLHRRLEEAGIVCAPREGMLRFSPHFYNDASDVDRVVDTLRRLTS